jgi:hypothetical protein
LRELLLRSHWLCKVHQPPSLLKCGEEAHDFSFGLIAGYRDRHGLGCFSYGRLGLRPLPSVHEDYHERQLAAKRRGRICWPLEAKAVKAMA